MPSDNCSIRFYLNDKVKGAKGAFPIYGRIILNRKKAEFATDEFCKTSNWDKKNGQPIKNGRISEYLTHIRNEIYKIKREFEYTGKPIDAKSIRNLYKNQNKGNGSVALLDYYHEFERKISQLDYSKGRIRHYRATEKYLKDFLKLNNNSGLPIQNVDLAFLEGFNLHLSKVVSPSSKRKLSKNTIISHNKRFRAVLNDALKNELIHRNPYRHYKLKNEEGTRVALTNAELEALKSCDLNDNESLQRVRDIFLFSCFTGLRFSDAQNLKPENISTDENGRHWINVRQGKTDNTVTIPLLKPAFEIYSEYELFRSTTNRILPKISNQKFNSYIKIIAAKAGINKNLTHHIARHTFATTVTLSNDVPIEIVSSFLGHTSIKTTQVYAKITNKYKAEYANKLDSKFNKW